MGFLRCNSGTVLLLHGNIQIFNGKPYNLTFLHGVVP